LSPVCSADVIPSCESWYWALMLRSDSRTFSGNRSALSLKSIPRRCPAKYSVRCVVRKRSALSSSAASKATDGDPIGPSADQPDLPRRRGVLQQVLWGASALLQLPFWVWTSSTGAARAGHSGTATLPRVPPQVVTVPKTTLAPGLEISKVSGALAHRPIAPTFSFQSYFRCESKTGFFDAGASHQQACCAFAGRQGLLAAQRRPPRGAHHRQDPRAGSREGLSNLCRCRHHHVRHG
jgi:hypothetical protein